MGLFDFLKSKKKKAEGSPAKETAEKDAAEVMQMDESGLEGIEPLETRYTQEYQDFLASQEAAAREAAARKAAAREAAVEAAAPEEMDVPSDAESTEE